jgi:hypothetical protein
MSIDTDWRGKARPGAWYQQYYRDWDKHHPGAWLRGQQVPGRFYDGRWGSSTLDFDAVWFTLHGAKLPPGAHYIRPSRDMVPLSDKLDPTDTGVMRMQFRGDRR